MWVVDDMSAGREGVESGSATGPEHASVAPLARLRQVGTQLIAVGNQVAGATPQRGVLFLAWRRPRSLQVTLAIGRTHLTRGWAPYALGTELPFWLQEQYKWRQVLPLLRRYERLRLWSHPRLLRIPAVGAVVQAELTQLEAALAERRYLW